GRSVRLRSGRAGRFPDQRDRSQLLGLRGATGALGTHSGGLAVSAEPLPQVPRLRQVIAELRRHCPWTAQLTHQSLTDYLIEESHEVKDEIDAGVVGEPLRKELGDILLQVVLHAVIAEERGEFDL